LQEKNRTNRYYTTSAHQQSLWLSLRDMWDRKAGRLYRSYCTNKRGSCVTFLQNGVTQKELNDVNGLLCRGVTWDTSSSMSYSWLLAVASRSVTIHWEHASYFYPRDAMIHIWPCTKLCQKPKFCSQLNGRGPVFVHQ